MFILLDEKYKMRRLKSIFILLLVFICITSAGCGKIDKSSMDSVSLNEINGSENESRSCEYLAQNSKNIITQLNGVTDAEIYVTEENDNSKHVKAIIYLDDSADRDGIYDIVYEYLEKTFSSVEIKFE